MGTLFKLAPDGVLSTLVTFAEANGAYPYTGLIRGHDGDLYGVTQQGGLNGYGVAFRLSIPPTLSFQKGAGTFILSWSTNSTGFTLQSSTNIEHEALWADVTDIPSVVSSNFVITNTVVPSNRFYRLIR
jgi:uncharacterized repeat protein (TIGR03803 family)